VPSSLDCTLLGDFFGTPAMRAVFDSRALLQSWLDVEVALAEAEAGCGVIPAGALPAIRAAGRAEAYDLEELRVEITATQHPLVPLVRALTAAAGDSGRYVHYGATTQDVMDTACVLQVRSGLELLDADLGAIRASLAALAHAYAGSAQAGRTHGQHAVPITFGLKVGVWLAELDRDAERLAACRPRVLVGQLAGAAGTLATLGDAAPQVRRAFCARLGLAEPSAPWHAARDGLAELVSCLALLAATLERIALEIVRLQSTELAEAAEPLTAGHVGSSTMPQKRNPHACELAAAACKLLRGLAPVMVGSMVGAHERDMAAWATEWMLVPQAMILASGALAGLRPVAEALDVYPERMRANLGLTGGGIMAEALMMAAAPVLGRDHAHHELMRLARSAAAQGKPLAEVAAADPAFAAALGPDALERALDPAAYLGESSRIARRVADAARPG
jgi:adenylosuccinate lyase/3-carboxy-cis,cis-muconate cycloisomerase